MAVVKEAVVEVKLERVAPAAEIYLGIKPQDYQALDSRGHRRQEEQPENNITHHVEAS